jgi:Flp pilus assembly protein TadD
MLSKDTTGAIDAFARASSLNPENAYAWNNLGLAYLAAGRFGDAIEALETATGMPGIDSYMWNNLGTAYEKERRISEARDAYRQGSTLGSTVARQNLLRIEEQMAMTADGDETVH